MNWNLSGKFNVTLNGAEYTELTLINNKNEIIRPRLDAKNAENKSEEELVELGLEAFYRKEFADKYQTEVMEEAKAQAVSANETLVAFKEDLGKITEQTIQTVQKEINAMVETATQDIQARLTNVENETQEIRKLVHANDLTEDQQKEIEEKYPNWQPSTQYSTGSIVNYDGKQYEVIQDHTAQSDWTPDSTASLYKLATQDTLADGTEVIQDFKQPTGAHDAYHKGDKVQFGGSVYESTIDNNAYSPEANPQGWTKL